MKTICKRYGKLCLFSGLILVVLTFIYNLEFLYFALVAIGYAIILGIGYAVIDNQEKNREILLMSLNPLKVAALETALYYIYQNKTCNCPAKISDENTTVKFLPSGNIDINGAFFIFQCDGKVDEFLFDCVIKRKEGNIHNPTTWECISIEYRKN